MTWVNDVVQGLLLGGLYALFATGLSLVFGVMRLVNLAHGDLSIVAAFLALVAVDHLGVNPLVTLAVVVPLMFVLGYLLQRGLLNFTLRGGDAGQAVLPSILVTFGLAVVVQNLLLEVFSADSRGLEAGSRCSPCWSRWGCWWGCSCCCRAPGSGAPSGRPPTTPRPRG